MIDLLTTVITLNTEATGVFNDLGEILTFNKEYEEVLNDTFGSTGIILSQLSASSSLEVLITETSLNNNKYTFVKLKKKTSNVMKKSDENIVGVLHDIGNLLTVVKGESSFQDSIEKIDVSVLVLNKLVSKITNKIDGGEEKLLYTIEVMLKEVINSCKMIGFDLKSKLDRINDSSSQIADMIKTMQQHDSEEFKGIREVSLLNLVRDCIKLSEHKANDINAKLICEISPLEKIMLDPAITTQIINNLINNALEAIQERMKNDPFMEEAFVKITLSKLNNQKKLKFIDNGVGISKNNLKHILKFGFSTKKRGSGYGLSHCNSLAEKNGAKLSVFSKGINMGAEFNLEFLI
jgi:signal transduction histidine kinase